MPPTPSHVQRALELTQTLLCLPGKAFSWLILPMMVSILVSVLAAIMGWSVLVDWPGEVPVFGAALTVNSLLDMQWYIFALIVLFGGTWTYFEDRHVTVDFIALRLSSRVRAYISVIGNIFLLLPFCAVSIWYGTYFFSVAFRTSEGSAQGGLTAHWAIKGAVPVAFSLLALAAIVRIIRTVRELHRNEFNKTEVHHDS